MKTLTCSFYAAVALSISLLATSGAAQAALIDRGGGLIYDADLNITWMSDANYAKTSGYSLNELNNANGMMNWSQAITWAANLSYYDSVRGVTYDDWRLPITLQPDTCGRLFPGSPNAFNCTGSEMGHLYYNELGGTPLTGTQGPSIDPNLTPFTNLQLQHYWSGTLASANSAWTLNFFAGGRQDTDGMDWYNYALAVRPGDVAAVPVPAAAWLLGSGLIGLAGITCKRKAA